MRHIIGLSGGKDSTALALRLAELEPRDYEYICNETGNELPEMKAHWDNLEKILGKPIQRVRHARSLIEEIEKRAEITAANESVQGELEELTQTLFVSLQFVCMHK
jgi:3'-phosphoadenosine 5'-phosphosulfate sulfotransferase (PAPS reductase)/FAD synthetase